MTFVVGLALALAWPGHLALPAAQPLRLVYDDNSRPKYTVKDGVIELRGGRGWLRTPRPFFDFRLAVQFRQLSPDTDATIGVGGWPSARGGLAPQYRVGLPRAEPAASPVSLIGPKKAVAIVEEGRVVPGAMGGWQSLELVAEGRQLRVTLNGTLAGVYEAEPPAGYLLFSVSKGAVQLRELQIAPIERPFPEDAPSDNEIGRQGGGKLRALREVKPQYTIAAMKRLVQGLVVLEIIVQKDGSVGPVRIKRSLDPDLDFSAVATARRWRFSPPVLNGVPTDVMVVLEMSFTLR